MIILGINAYHPDSSAALVIDGKLTAAAEEERFRRIKHFSGFPENAIKSCLNQANISPEDIDYIAIPRQNRARLLKKIQYGMKIPSLAKKRLLAWGKTQNIKNTFSRCLDADSKDVKAKLVGVEHHRAHLAYSFFTSGFDQAFLLSCDALGDFASTLWGFGQGKKIKIAGEIIFPHSLGFFYTALTQYLGFRKFGDEYKVMGLASYGEPIYDDEFKDILKLTDVGFKLNLKYFIHHKKYINMNFNQGCPDLGLMFSSYLEKKLGKRRLPSEPLEKKHKDIAASLQERLEEAIIHLLKRNLEKKYSNLCLSGGVAFNCAVNGKITENNFFRNIYVPPAAGDAGLSAGAALYLWAKISQGGFKYSTAGAYLGSSFEHERIKDYLQERRNELVQKGCNFEEVNNKDMLCKKTAEYIASGKVVGWFQGRMEFGPRALGNRSILADPRKSEMKDILNKRIKHREPFRPFAPSILEEDTADYFQQTNPSLFMSFVYKVKEEKKKIIPAVVHVDGTARLQTVNKNSNFLYWLLINKFKNITGVPVLLNTSFNENEPIVCSPQEAINCFLRTKMDILVLGKFIIKK